MRIDEAESPLAEAEAYLKASDVGVREIARRTGVDKSKISRLKKRLSSEHPWSEE
jgi:DNA-binding MarR family transcriptional regulator